MSSHFCDNCFKGAILPGEPKGSIVTIGALQSYVAQPTSGQPRKDVALLYLPDMFGLGIVNNKIMPDMLADALGCTVYVPDLLRGDYPPLDGLIFHDSPVWNESLPYRVYRYFLMFISAMFVVGPRWSMRHVVGTTQSLTAGAEDFVKALREEKQLKKIGVIGYCLGGLQGTGLAGIAGLVDVAVIAHPGPLTKEDFEKVQVPISFICAEEDYTFKDSIKKEAEEIFKRKEDLPSEFVTYKGTVHGFAVRPNFAIPDVKEGFQAAFDQSVNWFKTYLLA